jgi:hypothetical protein
VSIRNILSQVNHHLEEIPINIKNVPIEEPPNNPTPHHEIAPHLRFGLPPLNNLSVPHPTPDPEPTCTVSQAPAYGGVYLIFLQPSLTPSYASTITLETQESAARQVAKDLYIDNEVTQYAFLDSMTMISAHVTWIKACKISRDPRVCDCRINDVCMLMLRFRLRVLRRMGLLIQGFDLFGMEGK